MKKILLIMMLLPFMVLGQEKICGFDEYTKHLELLDSNYTHLVGSMETDLEEFFKLNPYDKLISENEKLIKIPIIFHVVYKNSMENIPDSVLESQIDILNMCFRGRNTDLPPYEFEHLKADMNIEFYIHDIIRRKTDKPDFGRWNEIKFRNRGGSDAIEPNKILNVWIGELDKYAGYSQFPNGDKRTDGIAMDYKYIGGHTKYQGRILVHETGHWMNLRHTWGDQLNCKSDDRVKDTPKQMGPTTDCEYTYSCGSVDMVQNYMNYSDCITMFTHGQKRRARISLKLFRRGF